jgi:GT2 family glycosyltransferase
MPQASVVIVTRNRREDAVRAVASAVAQHGEVEVIVVDDASTDGTAEEISGRFPQARVVPSPSQQGYLRQRNAAAGIARGRVIVSIDDDAAFESPSTVMQTIADFDHPRIGAVAIPYVDPREDRVHQQAPPGDEIYVSAVFIGTAYAVRRDLFLTLGGFRPSLDAYWEEADFAIRLLAAGFVIRLGRADPLKHHESSSRDFARREYLSRRNGLLVAGLTVPAASLPGHMTWLLANNLISLINSQQRGPLLRGTFSGFTGAWKHRAERHPVPRRVFRLRQRLWRGGPQPLRDIEAYLPASTRPPVEESLAASLAAPGREP